MTVKLLPEHHLEFLSLKGAAHTCLSLHLSNCHIIGIHMPRLIIMRKTINDNIYKHLEEFKEDMNLLLLILASTYYF